MKLNLQKLSYVRIGEITNAFLSSTHPSQALPIPIEEIAEGKLDLEIVPISNLRERFDVDGCLDSSLSRIFIDLDLYMENENRTRFTIAHEVGHLVIHKDLFTNLQIEKPDDVYSLSDKIGVEDYRWLEFQAYSFAGQVLVPKTQLINEIESRIGKIELGRNMPEQLFPIFQDLLDLFKVSGEVLLRRLEKEGIVKLSGGEKV